MLEHAASPLVLSVTNLFFSIFLITDFLGEAWHTYFFRRKFSPRRILQVPDALFLEFFQKLFSRLAVNKNFSCPEGEIIRKFLAFAY